MVSVMLRPAATSRRFGGAVQPVGGIDGEHDGEPLER